MSNVLSFILAGLILVAILFVSHVIGEATGLNEWWREHRFEIFCVAVVALLGYIAGVLTDIQRAIARSSLRQSAEVEDIEP